MRITKKIISLLLVVSMLASFFAMTGFEASAALTGQQKTDFGLQFDDTTRKFKVLQLSDIQTDVGDSNISAETFKTVELAIKRYEPDLILLSGDQIQGGGTQGDLSGVLGHGDMHDSLNAVFRTFTPYINEGCKVIAVPGNHEYDYGQLDDQWDHYNSQSWYLDWDNNFSTVDLNGEPGAGNVTVSAGKGSNKVALNIALFNSKGDDEDGYLRPGGDDEAAYQQIVDWYRATNNTLASSTYSYKAQVTGQSSAYVPSFAMQHVILQEIYNSFVECSSQDGGTIRAQDHDYRYLFNAEYFKFKDGLAYTGILGEGPCPSTLAAGSTTKLYNALLEGDFLGMCFGHDHLNTFDVTDSNGFRFLMGGALTSENYNNGDPNVRYMEFTLDDATGNVSLESEIKSYSQMTANASTNVDEERIEAINGEGVQLVNTISVPKTVYIGHQDNNADPRKVQKKGTLVQEKLLDYETKNYYEQDLNVNFCVPTDAQIESYGAWTTSTGTQIALNLIDEDGEQTSEGTLWKFKIATSNSLTDGDTIRYSAVYTVNDEKYEIYNYSTVENIKMPAGYLDWYRTWRKSDNSDHYLDLHYVGTLSGANAYSTGANDVSTYKDNDNGGWFVSNIHYDYSKPNLDIDDTWVNHHGDDFYSMYFWSPSRAETTTGHLAERDIVEPARTDIYLDVSAMRPVSATDPRLDTGARIDFWLPQSSNRGHLHYVAGIGFYAGKKMYQHGGATVDENDSYATYQAVISAENDTTGESGNGSADNPTVFTYNSYAGQQSYEGVGTTHVNGNLLEANKIGNMIGDRVGYPLVVDSKSAALALNGVGMTMFTGVRVKGATSDGYRQLSIAIAPYYLYFYAYDKGNLRDLTMGDLMAPRKWSDYPNADETLWNNYITAYKNALICYAQVKTNQTKVNEEFADLNKAIVDLLNSNKGDPDYSSLASGKQDVLDKIDVPPILYVNAAYGSSGTIQTSGNYTDTEITFSVPTGADEVTLTVVDENDNAKSGGATVSKATSSNGTDYTAKVTGGTATANGAVYYRISYKLNHTVGGETVTKEWVHYAASYVKDTPKTEGVWVSRTYRDRSTMTGIDAHIHIKNTLSFDSSVFSARGVSGIMSMYGYQGGSFDQDTTVKNLGAEGFAPGYGFDDKVYMAVGTGQAWPSRAFWGGADGSHTGDNFSGLLADNRVVFVADRSKYSSNGDPVYWNGLKPVSNKVSNAGYENSNTPQSSDYIVANIYFDPQATGAKTVKPKIKYQLTNYDGDNQSPTVYKFWDGKDYTAQAYGGDYTSNSPNVSATGMFVLESTGANTSWANANSITMSNGTTYETYLVPTKVLSDFTNTSTKSRLIIHAEKEGMKQVLVKYYAWNNSTVGFAFVFNRVDKSQAHQAIDAARTAKLCKDEMGDAWWADYRARLFAAYVDCGNLWTQTKYTDNVTDYVKTKTYADANYEELNTLINEITGAGLQTGVKEHIENYDTVLYKVNSGDDDRYENQSFNRTMYLNNATALITVLKNRTTVYMAVDSQQQDATEANKNLHDAHLDIGYQKYIDDYVEEIRAAWNNLRLQEADYTAFNKYVNYYDKTNDTVLFMRDEYAGYNNDGTAKNYANEKALPSGMYTYATFSAFANAVSVEQDLKKPSETMALDILNAKGEKTGSLDRIYPDKYTYKNVASPAVPDTTVCLYNKARDAYEALEFRRAGEYYSANGQWTDASGITYYADYNKQDRGASYYYTPVFTTSYNDLTADITNAGYVVTDSKVKPTYTAGNNGDKDNDGTYDAGEIWVTNGLGEYIKAIPPWTEASWGGASYGFKNAYEEHITNATSTYQSTKGNTEQNPWILALYVEAEILPDIAAVDYYYDKLVPASYDMSQLENERTYYATYEKGGSGYAALEGYQILDASGNVLTDGAQWYTDETWSEYIAAKNAQPGIMDNAGLAENQKQINDLTQAIYRLRGELELRTMEDYRTSTAVLDDAKDFAAINDRAQYYYDLVNNKKVKVFSLRANDPASYAAVAGNAPLFKDHNYYTSEYITTLGGLLDNDAGTGVKDFAGQPMATSIAAYISAVNTFKAKYDQNTDPANMNKADTSTLQLLLNKTWIPEFDKFGAGNYNNSNFLIGSEFDGSKWYSNWAQYDAARKNALSFFNATEFDGQKVVVNLTHYGSTAQPQGNFYVNVQGPEFTVDKDSSSPTYGQPVSVDGTSLDGTVNKAAYDLVVAYYKLQLKKVSDSDDEIGGLTGYNNILADMQQKLEELKKAKVDVLTVDTDTSSATFGQLITVQRSTYDEAYINTLQTYYNTVEAMEEEVYASNYLEYVQTVQKFNAEVTNLQSATVYMDGWNSFYTYFDIKSKRIGSLENNENVVMPDITDNDTMDKYLGYVFGANYNANNVTDPNSGMSIARIRQNKGWIPSFATTQAQGEVNTYVQCLYDALTNPNIKYVPTQIQRAADKALEKISNVSGNAYDPYPLNGREQVKGVTEYTPGSIAELEAIISANNNYSITYWEAEPQYTGYNNDADTVVDGTYADNMWAAAGLTTEGGTVYESDKALNDRYVLVKGGRFLDALKDAIAYAKSELYDANGNVKQVEVLKGDGTVVPYNLFTSESVAELEAAIAKGEGITDDTTQAVIDGYVFEILDNTDINNTINLLTEAEGYYGTLTKPAGDEGLKYNKANYTYFLEELGLTFKAESESAKALVNSVWVDEDGNKEYELKNNLGSTYFGDTWDAYYTAYINAVNALRNLTANDQATINRHTTAVYAAREALKWNTIGETNDWKYAYQLGAKIEQINAETVDVYVFTNSTLATNGSTKYLTEPSYSTEKMSKYGQEATEAIIAAWNAFKDKYPADADYSKYAQMVLDFADLQNMYDNLKAKSMTNDSDFAKGANQLITDFIAGSYDYKSDTYVADYQTTIAIGLSDEEKSVRETQFNTIKGYLNEIDALLNGSAISDSTTINVDGATKSVTYIEALNHYTMELYKYVTTTQAQYAGFALDMRQNMIDYFNTTIDVAVYARGSEAIDGIIYQKEVRIFNEQAVNNIFVRYVNPQISMAANYPTINLLDDYVGLNLAEDINYNTELPKYVGTTAKQLRIGALFQYVGAYSQYYTQAATANNYTYAHDASALSFLTNDAIRTVNGETYILADPATAPMPDGSTELYYAMDIDQDMHDGEWYTEGYGKNILSNGDMYYLAAGQTITGSDAGGWFTDLSYNNLNSTITQADSKTSYAGNPYGRGTQATAVTTEIRAGDKIGNNLCWNAENRAKFIEAIKADQQLIDESTALVYEAIAALQLLPATDAYREVAGLIYAAMGKVPSYSDDNKSGVIINNANVGTLTDYKIGDDVCGQVFNISLLNQLGKENDGYYFVKDANGERYYAPGLPEGYTNGVTDVNNILKMLQNEVDAPVTIDMAVLVSDNTANNGINSVKEKILAELEKLTLGLADLSLITSLTKAFLYNNPSHADSLGSYAADSEFFAMTHYNSELGKTGNVAAYKVKDGNIMASSQDFHESGFYDFSKYTTTSLNNVISYLQLNYIINGTTAFDASDYDIENKTGFNIVFGEANYGTAYSTAVTRQEEINKLYAGLVTAINNLELRPADTVALNAKISEADGIKLNEGLYDTTAVNPETGKTLWSEFVDAAKNASSYKEATIINQVQVGQAEETLSRAIRALKLNVDSYAPVVTIHNTQNDLTKFHDTHQELKGVISTSDQMVAPSYIEPGLGGYTLYVYTNQINPHIVVSLEDAVEVANGDGSTRDVKASKPEKMTVTAQAMSGVTASVITPVLDENGAAEAVQKVAIAGKNADVNITSVSTQTAKTLVKDAAGNETYSYAESSSAYVVLNPSFAGVADGAQSAVKYSIDAKDSAVTKDYESGVISDTPNSANQFKYADTEATADSASGNDITVFVYYMNAMPEDGNESGVVDGKINASAVLTHHEMNGIAANEWTNHAMLYRTFADPVKSWEFSETPVQLEKKNAAYYDPTFGENNFGSFVYVLDPNAASGSFDYEVAAEYFAENGNSDKAKAKAIELLNSRNEYIAEFEGYVKDGSTTGKYGYKHYGATDVTGQYENWAKSMYGIDNGTLVFVHVADRFGNVCNRVIEWKNYDPYTPVLSTSEAGKVSVTEPGGSGVAMVDLFKYMGTEGPSLYIGKLYGMLHIDGPEDMIKYVSEDNSFVISAGAENAGKHFTVAVTDKAGNVGSVPVYADAEGKIIVTVDETFDNVADYQAKPSSDITTESGEDLGIIEFVFNGESTVLLNYSEPSSIVKAGPGGNVFANKKNVQLSIIAKAEVESIKLYNVATGTEEIWTGDNATVKDNGDGTKTWTVKYTFAEGEHNYKATAMVNGNWEASSVDFGFTATTKKVIIEVRPVGAGRTRLSFNDGVQFMATAYDKKEVPYGSVVKLSTESLVDGSEFYYWENEYTRRIISTADTMEFVAVTNMKLTAQFTTTEVITNDKKLVIYVNNAENVVDSFELADGEDYKLPAAPSLPEHVFKSWSMTKDEVLASEEKMIVVRPIYSLVVKNTVTLTEGNWTATGAGEYETVGDERALATISASATDEAGAGFLYWLDAETGDIASYNRTYTFHVIKDTELTPVYGDASAVVPVPVARISTIKYDDKADKVSFFAERSVPSGYTLIRTGIVVTKSASVASNEEAFILDASGVSKGISNSVAANGHYSAAVSATSGVTVYARAYVIYANADGDIITYYSPVSSYTA